LTQADIEKLSEFTLLIDKKTGLPAKLQFSAHPEDDANVDIPVEVVYSDYREVDGVIVPFRIEKYMNGNLLLELTVNSAVVNGN
jgi:hypothetical protein